MRPSVPLTDRSEVQHKVTDIQVSSGDVSGKAKRRETFSRLRRKEGDDDDGGDDGDSESGGNSQSNSGPGNTQAVAIPAPTAEGDEGQDCDGDECSNSSTPFSSITQSIANAQAAPPPPPPPPPLPPPPPPPSPPLSSPIVLITSSQSTPSTTSTTSTALPSSATTSIIRTSAPSPVQLSSTSQTQSTTASPLRGSSLSEQAPSISFTSIRPSTLLQTTTIGSHSNLASPSAASIGISSAGTGSSQAGIIVGSLVGAFSAVIGIAFLIRCFLRRQRQNNVGSSPPSSPLYGLPPSRSRSLMTWTPDMEQVRPPNPSHSHTSLTRSLTIGISGLSQATSAPTLPSKSPGLSNNPVTAQIVRADGSTKTIIKSLAFQHAKQVTVKARKQTPKVQQIDLYIEEKAGEIFPGEWPEALNKKPPPLAFGMLGVDGDGKAEKRKSLLLEHKPGGRWSDPFTVAWRGSGEADEGGTRWKNPRSWAMDQNARLNDSELKKAVGRKSGISL